MRKKQIKRKYTKKNPTSTEKLSTLQSNYEGLRSEVDRLLEVIRLKDNQNKHLAETTDQLYEETAMLRERNVTLIEAVEILARASRIEKQQRDLNRFNRSRNDTVALTNNCEAGYAHGYEKRR